PNGALETTPLFGTMFEELGILTDRVYANRLAGKRFILRNGTLHALPTSPGSFLSSRLWSTGGKLRLLKEPFVGRAAEEESIAQFVERRLGREFLDYAINPFVAGVYAGNPEELSVRAAFPKLYNLEERYGGLIRGMVRGRKERKARSDTAKNKAELFSFREGMEEFPRALSSAIGSGIRTGTEVTEVCLAGEPRNGKQRYRIIARDNGSDYTLDAGTVVFAAPAYVAGRLIAGLSPSLSSALDQISYPAVGEVFLGFREDAIGRALDGFGFLVPAKERRSILGTIWSSSLFEGRAPAGHAALTTFVGGSRQPQVLDRNDDDLVRMVVEELQEIMQLNGNPVFTSVTRWPRAIPQYHLGYHAITEAIDAFETCYPGLYICSNYRGGIAVGDCVMSAERTATRILGQDSSKQMINDHEKGNQAR
ncbi:MAG: protoporphyrinogen oxidase, partial [Ignavibacteria bacterium]|nr:protoporphyrinogen oxidase [Ignavibacteria bacterium]